MLAVEFSVNYELQIAFDSVFSDSDPVESMEKTVKGCHVMTLIDATLLITFLLYYP